MSGLKKITFPNPITEKVTTMRIPADIVENASNFPVSITILIEGHSLTLFIDRKFSVRAVERSVFYNPDGPPGAHPTDQPDAHPDAPYEAEIIKETPFVLGVGSENQGPAFGKMLALGLSKSGKTSIIERFSKNVFNPDTRPTLGTQLIRSVLENYNMTIYDVGGQKNLRQTWFSAVPDPDALIFVVDVAAPIAVMRESREEFDRVVEHYLNHFEDRAFPPLLILGNKLDLVKQKKQGMNFVMNRIISNLEPSRFDINYHIGGVSALTGEGIVYQLKWLAAETLKRAA